MIVIGDDAFGEQCVDALAKSSLSSSRRNFARASDRCDHRPRNWQPDLKDTSNDPNVRRATGGLQSFELSCCD